MRLEKIIKGLLIAGIFGLDGCTKTYKTYNIYYLPREVDTVKVEKIIYHTIIKYQPETVKVYITEVKEKTKEPTLSKEDIKKEYIKYQGSFGWKPYQLTQPTLTQPLPLVHSQPQRGQQR